MLQDCYNNISIHKIIDIPLSSKVVRYLTGTLGTGEILILDD
jgi:hypothetical protein